MGGYVVNFIVYTMAMLGLISFAVVVYKKFMDGSMYSKSNKQLKIEETMSLNPRKTLHIVSVGSERFLIASDIDRTTLISKLNSNITLDNIQEQKNVKDDSTKIHSNKKTNVKDKDLIQMDKVREIRETKKTKASKNDKINVKDTNDTLKDMITKINQL